MLRRVFLLFFVCKGYGIFFLNTTTTDVKTVAVTTQVMPSALRLEAEPDYPVAAGQTVHLHCSTFPTLVSVNWSWQHFENKSWKDVGSEMDLTLSEPEESGVYRCIAKLRIFLWIASRNHTVFIISVRPSVGEKLGIAAFVLALLVFIINLVVLTWMGWKRFGDKLTDTNTVAKGFPGGRTPPKGGLQPTESEKDVYMNYSSNNQAYSDLDPASMNDANIYSSLS